ncbi:hypothetical protein [Phenylobacterium sp.]|uniref:hypothetical protein n=1 Tax=Phenylobacterium sp. TaxID=1871053 RepID=UPI0025DE2026|nr:hypothetical protein [Phenylobacterium sp.]MCA3716473.1 hypothetical protein [Phenylobacterium sp.]
MSYKTSPYPNLAAGGSNVRDLTDRIGEGRARDADRAAWLAALGDARHVAWARRHGEVHRDVLAIFAGRVVKLSRHPFPIEWASAQAHAAAFLTLAKGFVTVTRPDLVEVLARSLLMLAEGCVDLLDIEAAEIAERDRLRQGGGA